MSLRAARRSRKDSSAERAESTEERETSEEVREEEGERYGELASTSFSSTIWTLTMSEWWKKKSGTESCPGFDLIKKR